MIPKAQPFEVLTKQFLKYKKELPDKQVKELVEQVKHMTIRESGEMLGRINELFTRVEGGLTAAERKELIEKLLVFQTFVATMQTLLAQNPFVAMFGMML